MLMPQTQESLTWGVPASSLFQTQRGFWSLPVLLCFLPKVLGRVCLHQTWVGIVVLLSQENGYRENWKGVRRKRQLFFPRLILWVPHYKENPHGRQSKTDKSWESMPLHINSDKQIGEAKLPPIKRHAHDQFPPTWSSSPGPQSQRQKGVVFSPSKFLLVVAHTGNHSKQWCLSQSLGTFGSIILASA